MAMNREQRRAQLKALGSKFNGFDVSSGVLDIPVKGKKETLKLDMMDYNTLYNLVELADKFSNINETYKEQFDAIDNMTSSSDKSLSLFRIYKLVIDEFVSYVDKTFGEGSAKIVFGNRAPMPQLIMEFLEDLTPIIQTAVSIMNADLQQETSLGVSTPSKYSALREGNV